MQRKIEEAKNSVQAQLVKLKALRVDPNDEDSYLLKPKQMSEIGHVVEKLETLTNDLMKFINGQLDDPMFEKAYPNTFKEEFKAFTATSDKFAKKTSEQKLTYANWGFREIARQARPLEMKRDSAGLTGIERDQIAIDFFADFLNKVSVTPANVEFSLRTAWIYSTFYFLELITSLNLTVKVLKANHAPSQKDNLENNSLLKANTYLGTIDKCLEPLNEILNRSLRIQQFFTAIMRHINSLTVMKGTLQERQQTIEMGEEHQDLQVQISAINSMLTNLGQFRTDQDEAKFGVDGLRKTIHDNVKILTRKPPLPQLPTTKILYGLLMELTTLDPNRKLLKVGSAAVPTEEKGIALSSSSSSFLSEIRRRTDGGASSTPAPHIVRFHQRRRASQ